MILTLREYLSQTYPKPLPPDFDTVETVLQNEALWPDIVGADGGVIYQNPSPFGLTYGICWLKLLEDGKGEAYHAVKTEAGVCPLSPFYPDERGYTNNMSELYALAQCLYLLPEHWSGIILSDSEVTLTRLYNADTRGCPGNVHPDFWQECGKVAKRYRDTCHWVHTSDVGDKTDPYIYTLKKCHVLAKNAGYLWMKQHEWAERLVDGGVNLYDELKPDWTRYQEEV